MFLEAGGKKVAPFPRTLTGTPKELGGQDSSQFYCQKPQLGRGGGAEATGVKEGTPLARRPLVLGDPLHRTHMSTHCTELVCIS